MRIRKFVAADMKDALADIKRDLGNEALIVAVRPVRRGLIGNGVEVTAAVDIDDGPSAGPTLPDLQMPSLAHPAPTASALTDADLERIMAPLRSELRSLRSQLRAMEPSREEHGIKEQ